MSKFWLLLWGLICAFIPDVRANGLYQVDVVVDVVDKDAAQAREKALVAANRQGLVNLLQKITTDDGVHQVSELNDNQILNFIKDVSVVSEKVSNVRYMAELKVNFNEPILKAYLREKNIPFTENGGFKALVIPLMKDSKTGNMLLWEEENLWRKTWEQKDSSDGLVEYLVVEPTAANQEMLSGERLMEFDSATLEWLSRNYKADEIYIMDAQYRDDGFVVKIFAPSGRGALEKTIRISTPKHDATDFEAAKNYVKKMIAARIKSYNIEEAQKNYEILALYEYADVEDWLALKKELKDIPYVKDINEEAMGAGRVQVRMRYSGQLDRLENALISRRLFLQPYDGFYVILRK